MAGVEQFMECIGADTLRFLALPLGELSPQVTERALSGLAVLGHISHRKRQGVLA